MTVFLHTEGEREDPMASDIAGQFLSTDLRISDMFDPEDTEICSIGTLLAVDLKEGNILHLDELLDGIQPF